MLHNVLPEKKNCVILHLMQFTYKLSYSVQAPILMISKVFLEFVCKRYAPQSLYVVVQSKVVENTKQFDV